MRPRLKLFYRAIALALVTFTGGLAGGMPLLDAHPAPDQAGVEETHDASRCSAQHNHALCVVFQQTAADTRPPSALEPLDLQRLQAPDDGPACLVARERFSSPSARAPPVLL